MNQTLINRSYTYIGIIEHAEHALSAHYNKPLSLDVLKPIQVEGRSLIFRCAVKFASHDLPRSIIIKHPNGDLPVDKRIEIVQTSRNEQAILQLLTDVSGRNRYGPTYYTGDHLTGLLIIEDLGDYRTLQDVLYDEDIQQASEALTHYGRCLARMQLATREQVGAYTAHLRRFGDTPRHDVLAWDLRDHLSDLHGCLGVFEIEATTAFNSAIHDLACAMQDPGPFYTLSHCDAGPHNIMVLPEQPILIDFENACFQHGFVDLVQARMAFPSAGLGRRSSPNVIEQMEMIYRDELIKGVPQAADDQVFERALVEACAQVLLTMLAESWQRSSIPLFAATTSTAESDVHTQRLITFLEAFLHAAESFQQLPDIRTIVQKYYDRISNRWPGIGMLPYFPVFQSTCND